MIIIESNNNYYIETAYNLIVMINMRYHVIKKKSQTISTSISFYYECFTFNAISVRVTQSSSS